jgi:hypothetical protein
MTNWKYTDATNTVAFRTLDNGGMESCLASVLPDGTTIEPADPQPNPRIAAIDAEILQLETKAIRPMRDALAALAAGGQPDAADTAKIQEYSDAIKSLRAERAGL